MPRMAQNFDICIRGAGIVGKTLALLLARERLKVALVPAAAPKSPAISDVRAYALNMASRRLLESLRSWPDTEHATAVKHMQVLGDQDAVVRFDAETQSVEALAWIVDVPALESRLAEAVRYQPQVEVVDAPVAAALTVVCEGRASSTRAEFGVNFDVTPTRSMRLPRACVASIRMDRQHASGFHPTGFWLFCLWRGPRGTLWRLSGPSCRTRRRR